VYVITAEEKLFWMRRSRIMYAWLSWLYVEVCMYLAIYI